MGKDTRTREQQAADRDAKIEALQSQLTCAVEALVTGEDWRRAMVFAAKFRRYSFGNVLLLAAQAMAAYEAGLLPKPYPEYVAGYRQWQSLGRQVRTGTRGFQVMAPRTARFAVTADGTARRLAKGEKTAPGETVSTRMTGVTPATVFPVEFTDGDPLPERPTPKLLEGRAPPGLWDGLAAVIRDHGFTVATVRDAESIGGANGITRWTTRQVLVRADMDPLAMAKTLAHDLLTAPTW